MPFKVRAIQVDRGSEFFREFEQECQGRGINLFVLPPKSPKLNGCVERAQRTHTEEFYEVSECSWTEWLNWIKNWSIGSTYITVLDPIKHWDTRDRCNFLKIFALSLPITPLTCFIGNELLYVCLKWDSFLWENSNRKGSCIKWDEEKVKSKCLCSFYFRWMESRKKWT